MKVTIHSGNSTDWYYRFIGEWQFPVTPTVDGSVYVVTEGLNKHLAIPAENCTVIEGEPDKDEGMVDLLAKYIAHILETEGTDYLDYYDLPFTEEETKELKRISALGRKKYFD